MNKSKHLGVSLIELMTTVAILAILASLAAPSVKVMIENNRTKNTLNEVVSSLHLARGEATKRGYDVVLCAANSDRTACQDSHWSAGWLIFIDYNGDGSLAASSTLLDTDGDQVGDTAEEVLYVSEDVSPYFSVLLQNNGVDSTTKKIIYKPTGFTDPRPAPSVVLQTAQAHDTKAKVHIELSGRVRSCLTQTDTGC